MLWRSATELHFHSEVERDALVALFGVDPARTRVVPHGESFQRRTRADRASARTSLDLPADALVLLSIGFIQRHKGFDRAVRAFAGSGAAERGAELHVVGSTRLDEPEFLAYLDELTALVDATAGAHLHVGYVSDERFDRWLVACDVVVLPYREIWSSGVLERAALYDRPVIATRVGGLADQAGKRDVTFVDDDDELRSAVRAAAGLQQFAEAPDRWPGADTADDELWAAGQAEVRRRAAQRRGVVVPGRVAASAPAASRLRLSAPVRRLPPAHLPAATSSRLGVSTVNGSSGGSPTGSCVRSRRTSTPFVRRRCARWRPSRPRWSRWRPAATDPRAGTTASRCAASYGYRGRRVRPLAQRRAPTGRNAMTGLRVLAVALAAVAGAALAGQPASATQYGPYEVHGAIEGKWLAVGGPTSTLGLPITSETGTPDGIGRFNHFADQASIYWTPATNAHIVQGAIRGAWSRTGWERGPLGYPVTDENGTPLKTGRYSLFQGAIIYWSPASDAHEIQGRILDDWAAQGWENGRLGFPVSDEYAVPGGRAEDFQNGRIVWSPTSPTRITVQDPTAERFPTCDALRAQYPHGVGLPHAVDAPSGGTFFLHDVTLGATLYRANAALDVDRDGVACEGDEDGRGTVLTLPEPAQRRA